MYIFYLFIYLYIRKLLIHRTHTNEYIRASYRARDVLAEYRSQGVRLGILFESGFLLFIASFLLKMCRHDDTLQGRGGVVSDCLFMLKKTGRFSKDMCN